MSISDHTINAQYEYRIANIVRKMIHYQPVRLQLSITQDGDSLETFLNDNPEYFVEKILDDIQEYMGFDELLKQVKEK